MCLLMRIIRISISIYLAELLGASSEPGAKGVFCAATLPSSARAREYDEHIPNQ